MIADGDSAARNAFRVALLTPAADETPLPVNLTQELDPGDILEVRDMAEAIARAEQIVAAPRSSSRPITRRHPQAPGFTTDLFESLGRRPTDDTAGPATPAPIGVVRPTPMPPAMTPVSAMVLSLPSAVPVIPVITSDEDAYFQPAGRIRSLADVTLDGYRPEPTLLLRARARRRSFSWLFGAMLLPLVALAAYAITAHQDATEAPAAISTTTIATATLVTSSKSSAKAAPPAAVPVGPVTPSVPVFDVNSLPTAGSRK